GVALHRNTALDYSEGETFGLQVTIVDGNQGGELRAGGMAHDEKAIRVAAVLGDMVVHPVNGFGDIVKDINHLDVRQQAIARGDEDQAFLHESLRLELNAGAVPCLPTATMNPENDREIRGAFRCVDVEFLAWIGRFGVRDVALKPHFG